MIRQSQWFLKWGVPASVSALVGGVLLGTLYWAAARTDEVAAVRQKGLVSLIVSKMQSAVAHDQESATVWDDAVVKTKERDLDWLDANLGRWMNTYFGHDVAIVLSADGQTIYQFVADSPRGCRQRTFAALIVLWRTVFMSGLSRETKTVYRTGSCRLAKAISCTSEADRRSSASNL
ncbi:CHASE4 domain-containing protein [Rhizobium ruizarguesonis]